MISVEQTDECLTRLGTLKFFPVQAAVAAEIGGLINDLCGNDTEGRRLVTAILNQFSEWPGPAKLKEIYKAEVAPKHSPVDNERCPNCAPYGAPGWREVFVYTDRKTGSEVSREFPTGNTFGMDGRRELEAAVRRSQNHDGYFVMQRCSCPAGRRGAEYDATQEGRYWRPAQPARKE